MGVSREEIAQVALLSRLEVGEDDLTRYAREIGAILDYVRQLEKVDVEGIEPTSHTLRLTNVLREDVVRPSLSCEDALSNAPDQADDCFRVPAVLKGASS